MKTIRTERLGILKIKQNFYNKIWHNIDASLLNHIMRELSNTLIISDVFRHIRHNLNNGVYKEK